jgi:thymidylate synthase (FAD)
VFLVGRQQVDERELSRFLDQIGVSGWTTDAPSAGEKLIETAGRVCYESFKNPRPGGNKAYISHILEVAHGSVLEHEVFSVIITGISRSLSHELVRHRVGLSPSQLSQRYVDESDVAFVVPPAILEHMEKVKNFSTIRGMWEHACNDSLEKYKFLVASLEDRNIADATARRKAAREAARSVLPNCTETKIFLTGNARAWRHFCELRGSAGADAEIRRLALVLLPVLQRESPHVFGDFEVRPVDGVETIHTPNRKV